MTFLSPAAIARLISETWLECSRSPRDCLRASSALSLLLVGSTIDMLNTFISLGSPNGMRGELCAEQDSNLQHPLCHGGALPIELSALYCLG